MGFAYSSSMQMILLVASTSATLIMYYASLSLALMLNGADVRVGRKLLFVIILTAVRQIVIYGLYFSGLLHRVLTGQAEAMVRITNPLLAVLFYILLIYVTGLSKYRCLHVENILYIYGTAINMLSRIVAELVFPQVAGPYNYFTDLLRVITGVAVNLSFYFVLRYLLQKYKFIARLNDNIMMPHFGRKLVLSVLLYFIVYIVGAVIPSVTTVLTDDAVCVLLLFAIAAIYVAMLMNSVKSAELENKDVYIHSLIKVNNDFREVKHDFANILQGYSGYIALEQMDKLKTYHESVTKEMVGAGERLTLAGRLEEDPLTFSLLIEKLAYAQKMGVDFRISIHDKIVREQMSDLDALRFAGILLDNAIEASAESEAKKMAFSYYVKPNGNRLYVVSNSTKDEVDLDKMLEPGITTKEGHMGQGLSIARKMIGKYQHCSINYSCYENEVTIYVEVGKKTGEAFERVKSEA